MAIERWRNPGVLSLALALGGCHCDAPPPAEASSELRSPEPWTLGAADGDVVLPPPCLLASDPLAAVMSRSTRLQAVAGSLDQIVAIEGTLAPTRGRPSWSPDAAGVMPLTHGRSTPAVVLPWAIEARAARSAEGWLVAREARAGLSLWRDGLDKVIAADETLVDLGCGATRCAILSQSDRPRLRLGGFDHLTEVDLAAGQRGFTVAAVEEDRAVVTTVDDLRVRFFSIEPDGRARELAALEAPAGALAALASPLAALVRRGFDARGCRQEAGGVDFVTQGGALSLISALPPEKGALVALAGGGAFAAWLAPVRCGATARTLHAAVVAPDRTLAGPVTTVAEADGFALASAGDRVSLFIERRGDASGRGTVSYLPMRCAMEAP